MRCVKLAVALILATTAVHAKPRVRELPEALQSIQSKYIRAGTLMAEFTQTNKSVALNKEKKSSGVLMAKRPDKMRWETLRPDKNLLVSDGRTFWFYTPPFDEGEHGQVVEKKASQVQSKLANALLSGNFSDLASMNIRKLGPVRFRLTPRKGTAGTVVRAEIEIDPKLQVIRQVSLFHSDGNSSVVTLSNIKLGESIDDGLFRFTPPPGTEKVNG